MLHKLTLSLANSVDSNNHNLEAPTIKIHLTDYEFPRLKL
jgi:hypothetical protein